METGVRLELHRMLDRYALDEGLNRLLKEFVREKENENLVWSDLTRYVHFMLGGNSPLIDRAAAVTELVILLLDIVDDLQDQDNKEKPWMTGDPAVTLNALLALFAAAIGELGGGDPSASSRIGELLANSIHGQQADITRAVRTEEDYFAMVERKSGSLLQFACFMGYSLVPLTDAGVRAAIDELAACVGIVAQIDNDVRDVQRYDRKNDLLQKKRTLPILFLLEDSREECPELDLFYEGAISEEEFLRSKVEVLEYVRDSGCIEYCQVIQSLYIDRAEELYRSIPAVSPWAERFMELIHPHSMTSPIV
ncbi:polyprenyl synthetase family protein [Cohnella xylanilytica]|uniref:Polyprenyl synthetase family protein n=1 Tax=Cohnella xylanilytica TaxID=557555 RepID=A0A841TYG6_9BACL|nr:polyprenyl synthetase family protein [Cohnella xylanilytica]MBB6690961.1 polyprenyl synthetase family protein [Cohnella xylanilytica]